MVRAVLRYGFLIYLRFDLNLSRLAYSRVLLLKVSILSSAELTRVNLNSLLLFRVDFYYDMIIFR